ncbi:copper-transporting ATPase PAA1, chloroplastic-like [Dioscorea cayenensis subsp. rotundata]|uniref:Copper-transporting ATPase PAA1, chloroplastic-like n=1 Tax=Dioscorea cayennensis subsp. rotundata TaxID=55577 RepID=A0AB40CWR3_DIOCR|nr:copper-transporting ATPase PAA1, chloroplastic-like [Dioscorea cayenensis subsp. rotundata]
MATLALPKITLTSTSNPLIPGRSSLQIRFAKYSSTCFRPLIGQISSLRSPAQRVPTPAAVSGSSADGEPRSSIGDLTLAVEGMMCDGCAASVKRILESQAPVSSASVSYLQGAAIIWASPEAKTGLNWQEEVGEKLAQHLTTCGFKSQLKG